MVLLNVLEDMRRGDGLKKIQKMMGNADYQDRLCQKRTLGDYRIRRCILVPLHEADASERVKLKNRLTKMQAQAEEIREYEEKIHHLADQMIGIDLDDGVKHNYKIFQDVLAKIK